MTSSIDDMLRAMDLVVAIIVVLLMLATAIYGLVVLPGAAIVAAIRVVMAHRRSGRRVRDRVREWRSPETGSSIGELMTGVVTIMAIVGLIFGASALIHITAGT